MILDKSSILKKRARQKKIIPCSELGGDVIISVITAGEKEDFERYASAKGVNTRVKLITLSVIDDSGERMFSESDVEDLAKILSIKTAHNLFMEILTLNAFDEKDKEDLTKNSEPTAAEGSISA